MYTVSMNLQQYATTELISATEPPAPRAVVWQWQWQVAGGSGRVRKEKKGRKKEKKREKWRLTVGTLGQS